MDRRFQAGALAVVIAACWASCAAAGDESPKRSLDEALLVNGREVRRAFADAVAAPRRWTVTLLTNGRPTALGAIVEPDGWIVTKASQLKRAATVQLWDQRKFRFETVGYAVAADLALLKIDARDLPAAQWDCAAPPVGAWLASVGDSSLPIAVGVVGTARRKVPRSNERGWLGVELDDESGVRIRRVLPNSGASAAGLKEGDEVLEVNRISIESGEQLMKTLRAYRPGDTLAVRLRRADVEINSSVTLSHPFGNILSRMAMQNQMGGDLSFRRDDFEAVYQHDGVLKPEECGGPVVTLDGKAAGINIARAGRTETYVLPADVILSLLSDMQAGKHPPPPVAEPDQQTIPAAPLPEPL